MCMCRKEKKKIVFILINTKNPVTNNRKIRVQIKYFINEFAGYNLCGYSLIRISSDSISDVDLIQG